MPKSTGIWGVSHMDSKASSEGKGKQDRRNDEVPLDRAQAGLEDVLAWLRRMAHSIITSRNVFLAAGERGKLRRVFKTEVF